MVKNGAERDDIPFVDLQRLLMILSSQIGTSINQTARPVFTRVNPESHRCRRFGNPVRGLHLPHQSPSQIYEQPVSKSRDLNLCRSTAGSLSIPGDEGGRINDPSSQYSATVAKLRGLLFYLWTFTLALPLFVTMLLQAPVVLFIDKHRRLAQHFVNNLWAKVSTSLFYRVRVEGRENLPAPDQPAVYIANHQSFLDIFSLFHLNRPFKFISKTSIFFIPIVGWSMFLTGHVKLNRMDKRSQLGCLTQCRELLQRGASVLFFPEGTRATDMRLQEFKKGAFTVAAKAKVPVVPITIVGTGKKMPNKQENKMYPGGVEMIVHPQIQPASAAEMLQEARKAVQSRLP